MNFTFDSINAYLQSQLSLLSNWATTLYFGAYARLLDLISYVSERIVYVAEVYFRESNWTTMQSIESMARESWRLAYKPHLKQGAVGSLIISADSTFSPLYTYTGNTVDIPQWSTFTNKSKTSHVYTISDNSYYEGTVGDLTINVKEGIPKSFTYTAQGITREVITLSDVSLDNDEFQIFIVDINGNVLYDVGIVDNLYFESDLVNYNCQIDNLYDFSGVTITFGDGIDNTSLLTGQKVLIKYATTQGVSGDITGTNIIQYITSVLYDSGGNAATLYCNNTSEITDGKDYESLTDIRNKAPHLYYTGSFCAGLNDWIAILESFSTVYLATAWENTSSVFYYTQNLVPVSVVSSSGEDLTTIEKNDIINTLNTSFKSVTEIIDFIALQKCYVVFTIQVYTKTGTTTQLISDIATVLDDTYGVLNTNFQSNIYPSMYTGVINSVENVLYHSTTIQCMEYNVSYFWNSQHIMLYNNVSSVTECVFLVPSSAQLWLKRKIGGVWLAPEQIAYSLGTNLIGMTATDGITYIIDNGIISYSNDTISFLVMNIQNDATHTIFGIQNPGSTDALGYILSVVYNTQDGNGNMQQAIRLSQQNQITDVDQSYVFTTVNVVS